MKTHKSLKIVLLFVLIGTFAYLWTMQVAVNRAAGRMNKVYREKTEKERKNETEKMYKVPGYNELLKQRGLLNGTVKMAAGDSVGLLLDLSDSTACLMIKGVGVRSIPITEWKVSPFFSKIEIETLYDLLSETFRVTTSRATLKKEPLNVVQAPKDSSDMIPQIRPDTTHTEPVFFILDTDKPVRFYFYQTEGDAFWTAFVFGTTDRWRKAKAALKALFAFTLPEYIPTVYIGISKRDAKVLYRALPVHGQIVLTL